MGIQILRGSEQQRRKILALSYSTGHITWVTCISVCPPLKHGPASVPYIGAAWIEIQVLILKLG